MIRGSDRRTKCLVFILDAQNPVYAHSPEYIPRRFHSDKSDRFCIYYTYTYVGYKSIIIFHASVGRSRKALHRSEFVRVISKTSVSTFLCRKATIYFRSPFYSLRALLAECFSPLQIFAFSVNSILRMLQHFSNSLFTKIISFVLHVQQLSAFL